MKVTDLSRVVTGLIFLKMKQLAFLNEVQIQYFKVPKLKATSTYAFALIFCSKVWLNLEFAAKMFVQFMALLVFNDLRTRLWNITKKKTSRK